LFNGKTFIKEIAFDVGLGLQHHSQCAHRAGEAATDNRILCNHITLELGVLSEHKRNALDVALNFPIDMKLASR
jgi:hypothetical protein